MATQPETGLEPSDETLLTATNLEETRDCLGVGGDRPTVFAVIPVFNRLHFTQACIDALKTQTYRPLQILVSDGGSTDDTVAVLRRAYPEVVVLTAQAELWWAGAMAEGIAYALTHSHSSADYVLMMNNDTQIPPDYVSTLVNAAQTHQAAVGALIVDSRDPAKVLDAGEYIDWPTYSFPLKTSVAPAETFCGDVDVLPGRGSLVPLSMIRAAGNVEAALWPHYLADYEFFCRLKGHGFKLGVCYETRLLAHIEETGILPGAGVKGFATIWQELFSRRSMSNVVDHWRFVLRHAPAPYRWPILLQLIQQIVAALTLRTPLRPFFLPLYWLLRGTQVLVSGAKAQPKVFRQFIRDIRQYGPDILCYPHQIPKLIRLPIYLVACPGPVSHSDCTEQGLVVETLVSQDILRLASVPGWYRFSTLKVANHSKSPQLTRMLWMALNPIKKVSSLLTWSKLRRKESKL